MRSDLPPKDRPLRSGDRVVALIGNAPQEMKILWFGKGDKVRCGWVDHNGVEQEETYSVASIWRVPDEDKD